MSPLPPPQTGARPPQAAPATAPNVRRLKKGELLFAEGENSRAMYFVKSGMIRIFKKKGDSSIEIDTIHSGQVLGELAFLDGNPRSASGEALTECELVEVSGPTFQDTLAKMPEWLKILLKTVVGRLRTSSTRIRQLETASTAINYGDKDGKRSTYYVFLSIPDVLKVCTGILLVTARNGEAQGDGINIRVGLLQRYINQIMGVPVAKITSFLDLLTQSGLVSQVDGTTGTQYFLKDIDFLEQFITYVNEENLLEPSKRHDITPRGFLIMSLMAKQVPTSPKDERSGKTMVNIAEIRNNNKNAAGKEPFRMEEFQELVDLGYASVVNIKNATEAFSLVDADSFMLNYRLQRLVISINAMNEQKRSGAK